MVTSGDDTASTLDQATLDALRASVASVLAEQCGSTEVSAAVPATLDVRSLNRSGTGVSGTLRCLGAADAALLLAPADNAWVIVELAGAEVTMAPMWDRTRDVIDVRLKNATPAGTLPDAAATRGALMRAMTVAVAADSAGGARSITERTIAYMKTREQFGQPEACVFVTTD